MNKFIKIFILYIFLSGCNYQPIFSDKEVSFGIKNLTFDQNNQIENNINNNLKNYKNLKNKKKIIDLEISGISNKITTSTDDNGDPKSYRIKLIVETKIQKNEKLINKKTFNKSHDYDNSSNKFDLKKYENSIIENLISKISEEIIVYILSLEF